MWLCVLESEYPFHRCCSRGMNKFMKSCWLWIWCAWLIYIIALPSHFWCSPAWTWQQCCWANHHHTLPALMLVLVSVGCDVPKLLTQGGFVTTIPALPAWTRNWRVYYYLPNVRHFPPTEHSFGFATGERSSLPPNRLLVPKPPIAALHRQNPHP